MIGALRTISIGLLCAVVALCSGCAHSILVGPDLGRLPNDNSKVSAKSAVGYYISPENRALKTKSSGGGGDSVEYTPYKDLEPALFRVLSNHFAQVYSMKSPDDRAFILEKDIRFVLTPRFSTTSSSSSLVTWPPTEFSLSIEIKAIDRDLKSVWNTEVTGTGHATFSEFKSDFGLAAERASEAAFVKLQGKLVEFPDH